MFVTGSFSGNTDFDPGSGEDIRISKGDGDIFVCKYDMNGNYLWTRTWGTEGRDRGYDLAIDPSGNIFATGYFHGLVDFDPGPLVDQHDTAGGRDVFLMKLLPHGYW